MKIEFTTPLPNRSALATHLLTTGADALVQERRTAKWQHTECIPWNNIIGAGTGIIRVGEEGDLVQFSYTVLLIAYRSPGSGTRSFELPVDDAMPKTPLTGTAGVEHEPGADAAINERRSNLTALVAEVKERVGERWLGENNDYHTLRKRLGLPKKRSYAALEALGLLFLGVPAMFLGAALIALLLVNPFSLFLFGAWLFFMGFRDYRSHLASRDTPLAKISAAALGPVKLSSRLIAGATETAPLSGKICAYWFATIEHKNEEGGWDNIAEQESAPLTTLQIEDDSGRLLVWAREASIVLTEERWEGHQAAAILRQRDTDIRKRIFAHLPKSPDRELRLTEERIEPGRLLYVFGTLAERRNVLLRKPWWEGCAHLRRTHWICRDPV